MLVFLGWRGYMRSTLVGPMSWRSQLIMRRRRREASHWSIAWGFSCCSSSDAPFSMTRATNTLRWCGLKGCRILAGCTSGHGVGWDCLISTTTYRPWKELHQRIFVSTWGSNLICCISYYKCVYIIVFIYRFVDIIWCI